MLAQRFEVVRFIARGGMGEVYEADDLDLGERVALKIMRPSVAAVLKLTYCANLRGILRSSLSGSRVVDW